MKLNSILIAFDENYFETGEVMLYSLSKNSAQSFKIHFFYHEMSDDSLNELAQMIEKINKKTGKTNELFLYDIGALKWDLPIMRYWSVQVYFRLLAPEYILEDKVLYLDPDIIVQRSIDELFETDMNGVGFLMCEDCDSSIHKRRLSIPAEYIYCNSGVILMNLTYLREIKFTDLISEWLEMGGRELLECPDQDIINGVAYDKIKYADKILYNCWPAIATKETKVIHYICGGFNKPWAGLPPHWRIWWRYAKECEIACWQSRYIHKNIRDIVSLRMPYEFIVWKIPAIRRFRISIHRKMSSLFRTGSTS